MASDTLSYNRAFTPKSTTYHTDCQNCDSFSHKMMPFKPDQYQYKVVMRVKQKQPAQAKY